MIGMTFGTLIGVAIAVGFVVLLSIVGVSMIRAGMRAMTRGSATGRSHIWHKQPLTLFGVNNIIFALLILTVALIMVLVNPVVKYILIGLTICLLIISIVLVIRCVIVALQVPPNVGEKSE